MTKVPKLLTFSDTYWQLLTVTDIYKQLLTLTDSLLILTGTFRHLMTRTTKEFAKVETTKRMNKKAKWISARMLRALNKWKFRGWHQGWRLGGLASYTNTPKINKKSKFKTSNCVKMAIFEPLKIIKNWFHVKSEWQKNLERFTALRILREIRF